MLRIAIPNKGSLAEDSIAVLKEAGYKQRTDSRDLVLVDIENQVEFYYLRPRDIALYVGSGELEAGITGRDLLIDSEADAVEILSLGYGGSTFRFAAPSGKNWKISDIEGKRVASAYPGLVNAHLHISVDASSYMQVKWEKTMTTLVAIAKAASMINNLSVSISFRSGVCISKNKNSVIPYVVIAYDSRKDKFSKITQLFPLLYPNGSTPEGLAFQAIMGHIPHSNYEMDSYFVNLSDGEPFFNPGYFGEIAARHTRKQVSKMTENGIEVISYYLENDRMQSPVNSKLFKMMYGKDAQFIDVKNVVKIAHTLNSKFLSKENI